MTTWSPTQQDEFSVGFLDFDYTITLNCDGWEPPSPPPSTSSYSPPDEYAESWDYAPAPAP